MQKEIEPLQQLETKKDSLTKGIGRINDIYLSDPLRIGQVEVGTSIGNTLEVGRTKAAARKIITGLNSRLEQVGDELNADSEARLYNEKVDQKKKELAEMSELAAGDNIPLFILEKYQQEYEELVNLPKSNPLLQRGLDRIKQEEEVKRKTLIEVFPDGKVRLPNGVMIRGKRAQLLGLLKDSSENNLVSNIQLAEKVYPDLEESKGRQISSTQLGHLKEKLGEARIELVSVIPTARERKLGSKGGYYIRRLNQPLLPTVQESSQDSERQRNNEFRFEDDVEVRGVEARLLNKLSPFGRKHIVTRNELIQEIEVGETASDSQDFDQHTSDIRRLLNWRRFRLGELPNPNDPENNGYYVEELRNQSVHLTLLGEVVRYSNRENNVVHTRLPEKEASLLWALSSGDPKLNTDLRGQLSDDPERLIGSLNEKLSNLTGVEDVIVPVGNEDFGNWYMTKDTFIARRRGFSPLHPTRKEALGLIFKDDPSNTREEVIQTLGPTRGGRQTPRLLAGHQAIQAIRNSAARLTNRTKEGIATKEEMVLHREMQEYMRKHNLVDTRRLVGYIGSRYGFTQSSSSPVSGITERSDIDTIQEDLGIDEDRDFGVDLRSSITGEEENLVENQPAGTIEDPEFGTLSKADVSLIIHSLAFKKSVIEPFIQKKGIRFLDEEVIYGLFGILDDQKLSIEKQFAEGLIDEEELRELASNLRDEAFDKAQEIIRSTNFNSVLEEVNDQNPNVWSLLVHLYEIDDCVKTAGRDEGISLLAQDPEIIKTVLENPVQSENEIESDLVKSNMHEIEENQNLLNERSTSLSEENLPEELSTSEGKPRKKDKMGNLISYLNAVLELVSEDQKLVADIVAIKFPVLRYQVIDSAVENRWILPERENGNYRFGVIEIATLLYLNDHENLKPQLRKKVRKRFEAAFAKKKELANK